jgi:phosphohistidine phosphatase SixA
MKLILMRHEERGPNPGFFTELTDNGIVNSCIIPDLLKDFNIDIIFSSPFIRTLQTIYPYSKKYNKKIKGHMVYDSYDNSPTFSVDSREFEIVKKPNLMLITKTPGSCGENMVKNEKGKCVRIQTPHNVKHHTVKHHTVKKNATAKVAPLALMSNIYKKTELCPKNRKYNPLTGQCVRKCKTGFVRDMNFNCVKNKTAKNYFTNRYNTKFLQT